MRIWWYLKSQLVEGTSVWQDPIQVRWAVLLPKNNEGFDTIATDKFFVNNGRTDEGDAMPFVDNANCFLYMNSKINKREFGVLQEGQFLLSNDAASTSTRVAPTSKKMLSIYVPIKKQVEFAQLDALTGSEYPTTNAYFVWWFCKQGDGSVTKQFASGDTPIDHHWEYVSYFKDAVHN